MDHQNSTNDSNEKSTLPEREAWLALDLPIDPNWAYDPPWGSVEDGVRLSLIAMASCPHLEQAFAERDEERCYAEFIM